MNNNIPTPGEQLTLPKTALQTILQALQEAGYTLIGPMLEEKAIRYAEIQSLEDLPQGWADVQEAGSYRLHQEPGGSYFSYTVGPDSWKKFLYPNQLRLFSSRRSGRNFTVEPQDEAQPRYAFIGARACDLAAIAIQDRIFLDGAIQEPHYRSRRQQAFILAVNCTKPGNTCFCASMNSGPRCSTGFDLALTELKDGFVIEVGSPLGARMLAGSNWRPAGALEMNRADQALREAAENMGRRLDTDNLAQRLLENLEDPRWDNVAARCLSCTSCTMVCPTCFCSDVQDISDLTAASTARVRVWDSCFNPDFSHVHGGNSRPNVRARYRQWLTHKLGSWPAQFGTLGCVGCGRCITWCPVGIDLTEEAAAIGREV